MIRGIATASNAIRQTSDGGFVAAGSTYDSSQNTGAVSALILKVDGLILKVDGQGNVQWQRLAQHNQRQSAAHPDSAKHHGLG